MEQLTERIPKAQLISRYRLVRQCSEELCAPLCTEDYVVQPIADVSPPKWHLGHTTWFFETFILQGQLDNYELYDPQYTYVFNSYYETVGARVIRTDRGNLSRPTVNEVYDYRAYVDAQMEIFINRAALTVEQEKLIVLGLNHEQQHQELLLTDIKYILGHNPLFPAYTEKASFPAAPPAAEQMIAIAEGLYTIGHQGNSFCYDNELDAHQVFLGAYEIGNTLVSNAAYLEFMEHDGYTDFRYWHAEGWDWVKSQKATSPLYWHKIDGAWFHYTLSGLQPLSGEEAVCHINYFEASAYANWKGCRLPTEAEWEVASAQFNWGERWEWTGSAYLPYPGFQIAPGAIGEYNGKFMVNQMVLRGASIATSAGHSRHTYRNFFQTKQQWQFTGIRLAR